MSAGPGRTQALAANSVRWPPCPCRSRPEPSIGPSATLPAGPTGASGSWIPIDRPTQLREDREASASEHFQRPAVTETAVQHLVLVGAEDSGRRGAVERVERVALSIAFAISREHRTFDPVKFMLAACDVTEFGQLAPSPRWASPAPENTPQLGYHPVAS
jgi:hypothetical protein